MRRKKQKQKLAENAEEHTKDKKANKRFQRYSTNVSGGPTSQEEAATLAGYTFLANCIYSDKKSEWYIKDVMDLAIETYYYAKVEEAKIPGNCGCSKDVKKLKCLSFYGCKNKGNGVICTYECGPLCRNNPFRESNTMESKKMFIKTEQRYNGGWAVYSCEEIEEGEVIDEITGELDFTSPETVFDQKCFVLPRTFVLIDFRKSGRISRLFKNSCFPNVVIREFIYNGEIRLLALARFKIMKGEELTIDYNVEYPDNEYREGCVCGFYKKEHYIGVLSSANYSQMYDKRYTGLVAKDPKTLTNRTVCGDSSTDLAIRHQNFEKSECLYRVGRVDQYASRCSDTVIPDCLAPQTARNVPSDEYIHPCVEPLEVASDLETDDEEDTDNEGNANYAVHVESANVFERVDEELVVRKEIDYPLRPRRYNEEHCFNPHDVVFIPLFEEGTIIPYPGRVLACFKKLNEYYYTVKLDEPPKIRKCKSFVGECDNEIERYKGKVVFDFSRWVCFRYYEDAMFAGRFLFGPEDHLDISKYLINYVETDIRVNKLPGGTIMVKNYTKLLKEGKLPKRNRRKVKETRSNEDQPGYIKALNFVSARPTGASNYFFLVKNPNEVLKICEGKKKNRWRTSQERSIAIEVHYNTREDWLNKFPQTYAKEMSFEPEASPPSPYKTNAKHLPVPHANAETSHPILPLENMNQVTSSKQDEQNEVHDRIKIQSLADTMEVDQHECENQDQMQDEHIESTDESQANEHADMNQVGPRIEQNKGYDSIKLKSLGEFLEVDPDDFEEDEHVYIPTGIQESFSNTPVAKTRNNKVDGDANELHEDCNDEQDDQASNENESDDADEDNDFEQNDGMDRHMLKEPRMERKPWSTVNKQDSLSVMLGRMLHASTAETTKYVLSRLPQKEWGEIPYLRMYPVIRKVLRHWYFGVPPADRKFLHTQEFRTACEIEKQGAGWEYLWCSLCGDENLYTSNAFLNHFRKHHSLVPQLYVCDCKKHKHGDMVRKKFSYGSEVIDHKLRFDKNFGPAHLPYLPLHVIDALSDAAFVKSRGHRMFLSIPAYPNHCIPRGFDKRKGKHVAQTTVATNFTETGFKRLPYTGKIYSLVRVQEKGKAKSVVHQYVHTNWYCRMYKTIVGDTYTPRLVHKNSKGQKAKQDEHDFTRYNTRYNTRSKKRSSESQNQPTGQTVKMEQEDDEGNKVKRIHLCPEKRFRESRPRNCNLKSSNSKKHRYI